MVAWYLNLAVWCGLVLPPEGVPQGLPQKTVLDVDGSTSGSGINPILPKMFVKPMKRPLLFMRASPKPLYMIKIGRWL